MKPSPLKDTNEIMREFNRVLGVPEPFRGVGSRLDASGQLFVATAVEPYTRRDGAPSQLVTWRGHCATCGAPYDVKGSRHASHLPKNCEQHRGRRTKRARRRYPAREVIARAYVAMQNGDIERARKLLANEMKRKPELEE
jgi:hypothetical protein